MPSRQFNTLIFTGMYNPAINAIVMSAIHKAQGLEYNSVKIVITKELDEAVQAVRKNEKLRLDYMTLQMHYQEKYEQGIKHEKVETARRLIEIGKLSLEDIAAGTELSIEKVKEIAELQPV